MIIFILASAALVLQANSGHSEMLPGIHMEPNLISIGATYNGARVSISGEIPEDSEVLIRVSKEAENADLFKKGHVLGMFWMNVGEITFHNVPGVYMLYLPDAIPESAIAGEPKFKQLDIGLNALEQQASITPDDGTKERQFREFVKLKKSEGLYGVHENAVRYHPSESNPAMKSFSCELEIPPAMHQGAYPVTTVILKDGRVYQTDTRTLKIEETGLPAMVASLAVDHGAVYGVLATLIAIMAGLLMGVIFKGGKGVH